MKSIKIIEEPSSDIIEPEDLTELFGGWNCGSYYKRFLLKDKCKEWDKEECTNENGGANYCGVYSSYKIEE